MVKKEPVISVGIFSAQEKVRGKIYGRAVFNGAYTLEERFRIVAAGRELLLFDKNERVVATSASFTCIPEAGSQVAFADVLIGKKFHWERTEEQTFGGTFRFLFDSDTTFAVINDITVEEYLESVVSSEMSAEAPAEFLKAHAIVSRSWLLAMLERKKIFMSESREYVRHTHRADEKTIEICRWYDREDHMHFDVCADDHCQRYQGKTKDTTHAAAQAVRLTRGKVLTHGESICDARFHKACGGRTEDYATAWEDTSVPYLLSVSCSKVPFSTKKTEKAAREWFTTSPEGFCNVSDEQFLKTILPSFDQETRNFYRWTVSYRREELEELFFQKSCIDIGRLETIRPLQRGCSGRLARIEIVGSHRRVIVGKELEIRKWFSPSHLYSSGFVLDIVRDDYGVPLSVTLYGGGWGHGVGMCQIGAAAMAAMGYNAHDILMHYFRGAELRTLY